MFLVGGPAFSGTTLLALLLNHDDLVCLDEPDFQDPGQSHRGIPVLKRLFPNRTFPPKPTHPLAAPEGLGLIQQCHDAIAPFRLGVKMCDWTFIEYARLYRQLGYPLVMIVRDPRDALTRPLPAWVDEQALNERYRHVWSHRSLFDCVLRYEDLVRDPQGELNRVSHVLSCRLRTRIEWDGTRVPRQMLKLDRHDLLKSGSISQSRVGVWCTSGVKFTDETHETARTMGYESLIPDR